MRTDRGQDLLQKYLLGAITAREEGELFELAKNDAFLFEAIEGYSSANVQDKNIEEVRIELAKKYGSRSLVFPMPAAWLKVAASVIVLSGVVWVLRNSVEQPRAMEAVLQPEVFGTHDYLNLDADDSIALVARSNDELAKKIEHKQQVNFLEPRANYPSSPSGEIDNAAISTSSDYDKRVDEYDITSVDEKPGKVNENAIKSGSDFEISSDEVVTIPLSTGISESDMATDNQGRDVVDNTAEIDIELTDKEERSENLALRIAPTENKRSIQGTVVDDYGGPLVGASILVEGTAQGTITDVDGSFEIPVSDSLALEIIISFTGYGSSLAVASPGDELHIVMGAEGLLDEVVVTGYSTRKAKKIANITDPRAEPVEGIQDFKNYIKENQIYPDSAQTNNVHGKVKLRFQVFSDGEIGEVQVIKSLGFGWDEEAVRLIREGPTWEVVPSGYAAWKTWTFKF